MSSRLDRDELLRYFTENSFFSQEETESKVQPLFFREKSADPAALARSLRQMGLLTAYQSEAIGSGKIEDLRIGNYDVLDRLGSGGMGTVFKARHRRMKRIVALKVMSRQLCSDEKAIQRFQREVETIARLQHPNIVMAFDADEAEIGHFLVMEFVNGRDLTSMVQTEGPLSIVDALDCILQSARGLEYAHREGIIHRDIKPANLLLDTQGTVKVTDLGLARLHEQNAASQAGLTQAGGIVGTADYMSPEQAFDSATLDHRADIYSLGCTLFYLLMGKPPFISASVMGTLLQHLEAPIPMLYALRPDAPAAVDALFRKMIAKKAVERFQTMTEVIQAISAVDIPAGTVAPNVGTKNGLKGKTSIGIPTRASLTNPVTAEDSSQTIDLPSGLLDVKIKKIIVLLVEPSRTQAGIIRKYLDTLGIEVLTPVQTGREAIEIAKKTPLAAVISAMHLKDMTGVQLAQTLAEIAPSPGFILISSESEASTVGSLSAFDKTLVLHKPFTVDKLVRTLNAVTGLKLESTPTSAVGTSMAQFTAVVQPKAGKVTDRSKLKVLIVDDSSTARIYTKTILQQLGFMQFLEATDGAQAVALLARDSFDLIVSDYNMPLMDGQALLAYLRSNPATAAVPVIMVTTEPNPAKLQAIRELGVAGICEKSFKPEVLQPIIDRLFP